MTAGTLRVTIRDSELQVEIIGGGSWTVPVGPLSLVEGELEHADRPAPEQLTNALGIVSDHLEDVIRESAMVLAATSIVICGEHAEMLARVEVGDSSIPDGYVLARTDADEVFRTLVNEPIAERLHNPGLDPAYVETVIGTCCVVLALMRRLESIQVDVEVGPMDPSGTESG